MDVLGINKSGGSDDPWDDSLLIKSYDDSIRLAREELARRLSLATSKDAGQEPVVDTKDVNAEANAAPSIEYTVGDYVRATYEDGVDYEAKIISLNRNSGTCFLKYIGYENEQEVLLSHLIPSWGKKARRLQFAKAKLDDGNVRIFNNDKNCSKTSKKKDYVYNVKTIPPPPPMPPMLSVMQNSEESEHLSAMLMSWYMSGYYTGVYQGIKMAKTSKMGKK